MGLLKKGEKNDDIEWYRSENFMLSMFLYGVTVVFLKVYYNDQIYELPFTINNWMAHGMHLFSIALGMFIIRFRKDKDMMEFDEE